jgi:hypothetical protein
MPGVKATLHSFCSPVALADDACNLETFTTDITAGASVETQTGEYYSTPGAWKLVFHQKAGQYKTTGAWGNVNSADANCADGKCTAYSTLDQLERLRSARTGKFMFKQVWDSDSSGVGSKYNVWKQSSNPYTGSANAAVSGYEALDIKHRGRYSYTTVSYRTGIQYYRRDRRLSCYSYWYRRYYYYTYPVYTTRYVNLFNGLHRSSSPSVLFDGVTSPAFNYQYQQMTNFAIGTTRRIGGGIPADIGSTAQDVKVSEQCMLCMLAYSACYT